MFYSIPHLCSKNVFAQREGFTLLKLLFIAFLLKAISHQQSDLLDLVGFLVYSVIMSQGWSTEHIP